MHEGERIGAVLEAAATLGVLADIDRFKVVAAIAVGTTEIEDIVRVSGVDRLTDYDLDSTQDRRHPVSPAQVG